MSSAITLWQQAEVYYLRRAPDKLLAVSDGGGDMKNVQGGSEQLAVMCARVRTMSSFPTGDTYMYG